MTGAVFTESWRVLPVKQPELQHRCSCFPARVFPDWYFAAVTHGKTASFNTTNVGQIYEDPAIHENKAVAAFFQYFPYAGKTDAQATFA